MMSLRKTWDQVIYEHTAEEIIIGLTENMSSTLSGSTLFAEENGIDSHVIKGQLSAEVNALMEKYHLNRSDTHEAGIEFSPERMEIIKLGENNLSLNEIIATTASIHKDIENRLYGVLVSRLRDNKKETFNPFHPLIAKYLAEDRLVEDKDAKEFSAMVYVHPGNNDTPRVMYYGDEDDFRQEIINILAMTMNESSFDIVNENFYADIEDEKFVLKYNQKLIDKETGEEIEATTGEHLYIPLQIMNKNGLAYPFYGAVYSTKGVAFDISPMQSANISDRGYPELGGGSRVCTKLGNSKTLKGISALNHTNLTSPLKSSILCKGALLYGRVAFEVGLEMLTGEEIKADAPKEKPKTFDEWMQENEGGTLKDYLEYTKAFLENAEVVVEEPQAIEAPEEPMTADNGFGLTQEEIQEAAAQLARQANHVGVLATNEELNNTIDRQRILNTIDIGTLQI